MRRRLLAAVLLVAAGTLGYGAYVLAGLPARDEVRALARKNPGKTGVMRQREEEAKAKGRRPRVVQTWIPLERVSRNLIQAVIASEDQKFFGHDGVDWQAIQESVEANVAKRQSLRGGSTITQQLAKNLFFDTRKSLTRKVREMIVTHWLEQDLPKGRILALYLNVIEWGDGIYGCEAAGLVAMIPNPRRINPRVSPARHARAQRRVLWLMAGAGYIQKEVAGLGAEPPPETAEPEAGGEPEAGSEPETGSEPRPADTPEPPL